MSSEPAPANPPKAAKSRWKRPPEPSNTLKELGLRTLAALLDGMQAQAAKTGLALSNDASVRLLRRLKALFDRIPAGSLFPDWSPPASPPDVAVTLKSADVAADSERNPSSAGACPLQRAWSILLFFLNVHGMLYDMTGMLSRCT